MKIASATIRILNRACAIVALAIALAVAPVRRTCLYCLYACRSVQLGPIAVRRAAPPCSRAQSAPRPRAAR